MIKKCFIFFIFIFSTNILFSQNYGEITRITIDYSVTTNRVTKTVKFTFSETNEINYILNQVSNLKKIDAGSYPLYDDGISILIFLVTSDNDILKYTYSNLVFYDIHDEQGYELPLYNEIKLKNMIIEELIDMKIR